MIKYICLILLAIPYISSCQQPKTVNHPEEKISGREYYNKAISEYQKGSNDAVVTYLNKAIALIPKEDTLYPLILASRSNAYMNISKPDSALKDLEQLVKDYPQDYRNLVNLANLFGQLHRYPECIANLEKARSINNENPVIYMNLSYFSGEAGDYTNAIKYAEKGLTMTKDSTWTGSLLNNMGYAQSKAVSAEKGLRTVNRSFKFFPENSFAYFNRGRILLDMNDKENACANFIKSRDLGGVVLTEEYIEKYCK